MSQKFKDALAVLLECIVFVVFIQHLYYCRPNNSIEQNIRRHEQKRFLYTFENIRLTEVEAMIVLKENFDRSNGKGLKLKLDLKEKGVKIVEKVDYKCVGTKVVPIKNPHQNIRFANELVLNVNVNHNNGTYIVEKKFDNRYDDIDLDTNAYLKHASHEVLDRHILANMYIKEIIMMCMGLLAGMNDDSYENRMKSLLIDLSKKRRQVSKDIIKGLNAYIRKKRSALHTEYVHLVAIIVVAIFYYTKAGIHSEYTFFSFVSKYYKEHREYREIKKDDRLQTKEKQAQKEQAQQKSLDTQMKHKAALQAKNECKEQRIKYKVLRKENIKKILDDGFSEKHFLDELILSISKCHTSERLIFLKHFKKHIPQEEPVADDLQYSDKVIQAEAILSQLALVDIEELKTLVDKMEESATKDTFQKRLLNVEEKIKAIKNPHDLLKDYENFFKRWSKS